jgi:glycosyltransferase involved in cell wall biosynthesis
MRPYVLLLHDLSFLIEPRWFSFKSRLWHSAINAKRCIQNAAHLLAVSETTKRDAMRLLDIPGEQITVIPIGATLPSQTTNYSLDRGGWENPATTINRYVFAIGGDDPRKNAGTAERAVEILRHEKVFSNLELVLVGAGFSRPPRIESYDESHDTEGWRDKPTPTWIHRIPRPSDSELAYLYSNASAFLYPSWYEGYGLPLHEAAAHGTPCIASTAGALPETAPHGTLFADPAKPHHWIEALKIALSSPRPAATTPEPEAWNKAAAILSKTLDFIAK